MFVVHPANCPFMQDLIVNAGARQPEHVGSQGRNVPASHGGRAVDVLIFVQHLRAAPALNELPEPLNRMTEGVEKQADSTAALWE